MKGENSENDLRHSIRLLPVRQSDVFSMLIIGGLWIYFRSEIGLKVDEICLSLFGKNLSGRNLLIQIAVYGLLILLSISFPILLRRLIDHKPEFRQAADVLIILLLAVPAVQLLIICANQVLRRDDYWEIADALQYGFPGSMFYEIQRYNGRYTGWGLRSLHAIFPSIPYIDIFLFLNLILLTAGTSLLSHRLLRAHSVDDRSGPGLRLPAFVTGFGLALAFVLLASNVFEFWFWGSGTMIYGFGLSMCVLSIALVWNAAESPTLRSRKMVLPVLTCFLTCGCSELCTASLSAFLILLLFWMRIRDKKWNSRVLCFIGEVLLCCILIFSGSASLDFSGTNAHLFTETADSAGGGILHWIRNACVWAFDALRGYTAAKPALLLLFLVTAFLTGTQLHFENADALSCLILSVFLGIIAVVVLMINTLLDYMPPRVITIGICWVFTALALICVMLGALITRGKSCPPDRIKLLLCALLFAAAVNSFYSENINELRTIRSSWTIRDNLLRMSADPSEPMLTCSLPCPGSSRDDILSDPQNDFNIGTAQYYGVPEISAEVRCPPWGERYLPSDPYR